MNSWSDRTKAVVLVALALLIYGFGIGRGFDFDDVIYISENPLLSREDGFRIYWFSSEAFNYYPLFWSLLRLQWLFWGMHPPGYHLVNLLLHAGNAALLWRICLAWRLPGAWWVAALFVVHPVNVQTVAWAAEQKNTWSFLFMGLALLSFLRHARERDWLSYALSLLAYAGALACKPSTVGLPVFLALYYGFQQDKKSRVLLLRLIPYFALGLVAGLTTIWFEEHRVGAKSLMSTLSLWQRLEAAGAAFWFYLGKALLPIHLTPMYRGWVDSTAAAHTAIPGVLLIILMGVCGTAWRRIGAPLALGLAYYALMLLPLLGIFDTNYFSYSLIADHWQYHALPGVLVTVVSAAGLLGRRFPRLEAAAPAVGTITVLGVAALASAHFAHFEDARSLWTYVVQRNPEAWIGWYNLGNAHADERAYPEAIAQYRRSIAINPDYYRARFNLANALAAAGQLEEADRAFGDARALLPKDPAGYINRAAVLLRLGREDEALAEFQQALELDPNQPSAHVNLLTIQLRRGRIAEATAHLEASGVSSAANGRRIADAITSAGQQKAVPREALLRFAARACALSGNQPELTAAFIALSKGAPSLP